MPCFCVLSVKLAGHLFVPSSDFYKLLSYYRTHVDAFSIKKNPTKSPLSTVLNGTVCQLNAQASGFPFRRQAPRVPSPGPHGTRLLCEGPRRTLLPGAKPARPRFELLDATTAGQSVEMSGSLAKREPLTRVRRCLASSQARGERWRRGLEVLNTSLPAGGPRACCSLAAGPILQPTSHLLSKATWPRPWARREAASH